MNRREAAIEDAKEQLRESANVDKHIVNAVKLLDQLNDDLHSRMERFREWYSLHFPELENEIGDDEELIRLLERGLLREELDPFEQMAEESTGSEIGEAEKEILESVRNSLQDDYELIDDLENYISDACQEEMPNLSKLLGPILAAKLLAHTGSLEGLAKKPSSTVQMLGAEKALFRYLHGEGTPPKHGVLFEHPFVNQLPNETRGKMARFLANKTSIAARLDQYGDKRKGEELFEEAKQKFEELKEDESS